jgi:uncharacterized repeat protein (TIGR03803 family)
MRTQKQEVIMKRQVNLEPSRKGAFRQTLSRLCLALFVVVAAAGSGQPAAAQVTDLYDFGSSATDVRNPQAFGNIAVGADGHFYSTAPNGATHGYGGIFRLSQAGAEQVRYKFQSTDNPTCQPGLNLGGGGNMYGTCYGVAASSTDPGMVYKYTPPGTTITPINCGFNGGSNGSNPDEPPILATDGNYYGTTAWGGTYGYGTIYTFTAAGVCTPAIYSFTGGTTDGRNPHSLMQEIYTTAGAHCTAGSSPICLVGAAESGGTSNCGTTFQLIPPSTLTVLHNFTCGNDGKAPVAAMIQPKANGPLYGSAYEGGANGDGTIFKITPTGTSTGQFHLMHGLLASTDGSGPQAALVRFYDGNLYGTCINGGSTGGGQGTIFKITPAGQFTTQYVFNASATTGGNPAGGLVIRNKAMYGDTTLGGANSDGIFYSFVP